MAEKQDEPEAGGEQRSQVPALLREAGQKLMPALLTAGSLVGFVAFAGAVILWTRFEAIDLPPEQAIKAVPRAELVATGSALLLLFGFFGALALIGAYLVDRCARATPGMARALLCLVAVEGVTAIYIFRGSWDDLTITAALLFGLLALAATAATFDGRFATYKDRLRPRENEREWGGPGPGPLRRANGDYRLARWHRYTVLGLLVTVLVVAAVLVYVDLATGFATVLWVVGVLAVLPLVGLLVYAGKKIAADWRTERAAATLPTETRLAKAGSEDQEHRFMERMADVVANVRGVCQGRLPESRRARARKRDQERLREEEEEQERRRLQKPRPSRLDIRPGGVSLLLVLAVLAIVLPCVILHREWLLAVPLAVAVVLGTGLWRIATLSKPSFAWFGLALFVSVPLFGTFTLMAHNLSDPQVQPVALIRETDGPDEAIQGLYVTEGDERVYFANVATEGCTKNLVDHSGRLLWVPKDEVVAMAVGPLQDVEEAGKSALEMSYALTPGIETFGGKHVSVARDDGEDSGEAEEAEDSNGADAADVAQSSPEGGRRLESAGPAVRPDFGAGLRLVPQDAEPGDVVELRMSAPNLKVNGFDSRPDGHTLRLNGIRLAILRIPANRVKLAEYAKTVDGQVLPLERPEEGAGAGVASFSERFVRFKPRTIKGVKGTAGRLSLRAEANGRLTPVTVDAKKGTTGRPTVILPNGDEAELRYQLLRLAWSPTSIKFRLPETATTGVVSAECRQLAGQPALTVAQPPTARITVRMRAGSQRVIFDSGRSTGESAKEKLTRHWLVAGRGISGKKAIPVFLQPRLKPYSVRLTVTDPNGRSDTASLRFLRLPASRFRFGTDKPSNREAVRRVREAVREEVAEGVPAAIELHGHADSVGSAESNLQLSLDRVELVRKSVFAKRGASDPGDRIVNDGPPVPMTVRAFGETCPIVHRAGPQATNRRVEVFLLGSGATVATAKSCRAGRIRRSSW